MVRNLREIVCQQIEKKNEEYATKANNRHKRQNLDLVIGFECICGKKGFQNLGSQIETQKGWSFSNPRNNGPFQVLERINNNAYKLDLPSEYNISASFIVSNLSLFYNEVTFRYQILLRIERMIGIKILCKYQVGQQQDHRPRSSKNPLNGLIQDM